MENYRQIWEKITTPYPQTEQKISLGSKTPLGFSQKFDTIYIFGISLSHPSLQKGYFFESTVSQIHQLFFENYHFLVKMPVSPNDEFTTLATLYGAYPVTDSTQADKNLLAAPLYFNRSGRILNSVLNRGGRHGYYWSSTAYSDTNVYGLNYSFENITPQYSYDRSAGFNVRCIAR